MQYHYVVGYDTEIGKWFVESDTTAYFPDGNIWDNKKLTETGYGWMVADPWDGEGDPQVASTDFDLLKTLQYLVDTWPTPKESNAT